MIRLALIALLIALPLSGQPVCGAQPPDGIIPSSIQAAPVTYPVANGNGTFNCGTLTARQCADAIARNAEIVAEIKFEERQRVRTKYNKWAKIGQRLDCITSAAPVFFPDQFSEANPLFPGMNSEDDATRIGTWLGLCALKEGMVWYASKTESNFDDGALAVLGGAAGASNIKVIIDVLK